MAKEKYLELKLGDQVVARVYANRLVFVRAADYASLLKVKGARRVPEGISFAIDGQGDVLAAKVVKWSAHHAHDPALFASARVPNKETLAHLREHHVVLVRRLEAGPESGAIRVECLDDDEHAVLERFSQVYLADEHVADHEARQSASA